MLSNFIPIHSIEQELAQAEKELAKATEARVAAHAVENSWITEVTSLKNLLKARQERSQPGEPTVDAFTRDEGSIIISPVPTTSPTARALDHSDGQDVNRVNWMEKVITASGSRGMSPPELMAAATKEGISMHPNYPYTALRKLVVDGRLKKQGSRYFKELPQPNLALAG